jgi:glycosyltransferase involved in cell wall biosynthesis
MGEMPYKILIVGDYPPPYGGVSVQVSDLQGHLSDMPGYSCRVLDIGRSRRQRRPGCLPVRGALDFVWKLTTHALRGYIIHLHTNGHNLKSWLLTFLCGGAGVVNGWRTVVSLGSGLAADFVEKSTGVTRLLIRSALALLGTVICRNERTRLAILGLGIGPKRVLVLTGFYGIRAGTLGRVPAGVEEFVRNYSPVVGAVASDGPEYGLPLVIEAARRLRAHHQRLGVLLIGGAGVDGHPLNSHLLVTGELPHDAALAAMRSVDVFVRPTYFDGDASSVREALALGLPVVASDTDFRPDGVILFARGNSNDLAEKIALALANGRAGGVLQRGSPGTALGQLLGVYQRLHRCS